MKLWQQYTRLTSPVQVESPDGGGDDESEWTERSRFWHPGIHLLPPIVMINVYCDESRDSHTYAIAGWLAVPGGGGLNGYGWDAFTAAWRQMLGTIRMPDGSSCPAIHTAEIVQRRRIPKSRFRGWKKADERAAFAKVMDVMLDKTKCANMWPIGCSLAVPSDLAVWLPEDSDRFLWTILFIRLFHIIIEKYPPQQGISLMFDNKPEVRDIVNKHYYESKQLVDAVFPGKLNDAVEAFGSDEANPPLQAADFFAYEWRKQTSEWSREPNRPRREYYGKLRDGRAQNIQLHHYNADAIRTIRSKVDAGASLIDAMWNYPTVEV